MKKKILVIAVHPDDEVLGCGGTIFKHRSQGDDVKVLFISDMCYLRYLCGWIVLKVVFCLQIYQ